MKKSIKVLIFFICLFVGCAIIAVNLVNKESEEKAKAQQNIVDSAAVAGSSSKYDVKVDFAYKEVTKNNVPYAHIRYVWTNNSDKPTSFELAFRYFCFEDGIECREPSDLPAYFGDTFSNIAPGASQNIDLGYIIGENVEAVDLYVEELWSMDKNVIVDKKVTLRDMR